MIRVAADSGPLVALFNERDHLNGRAWAELERTPYRIEVCLPVLTEVLHLATAARARARLARAISEGALRLGGPTDPSRTTQRALEWLDRYSEHRPDFADAYLACWSEEDPDVRVWSFDAEFTDVWRTLKGRRVRMLG